jgi:hypothetical protein
MNGVAHNDATSPPKNPTEFVVITCTFTTMHNTNVPPRVQGQRCKNRAQYPVRSMRRE